MKRTCHSLGREPSRGRASSLDQVIERYKADVDRTLLRENLELTPDLRIRKLIEILQFTETLRNAPRRSGR